MNEGIARRNSPKAVMDRIIARSRENGECWEWTGNTDSMGYGKIYLGSKITNDRRNRSVHRVAWELLIGPIPDGLEMDHLCRNPPCWRPNHLEPVTRKVNQYRGLTLAAANIVKTHCPKGHPYSGENLYVSPTRGNRSCRECSRISAGSALVAPGLRTHCPYGHEYSEANTYRAPGGHSRSCRICIRRRTQESKDRRTARARAAKG